MREAEEKLNHIQQAIKDTPGLDRSLLDTVDALDKKLVGLGVIMNGDRTISISPSDGALGALRFGYAFSPKFALSLESYGFGSDDGEDLEWGLGAAFLAATWHPCGKGLFVRVGAGGGGGDYVNPDTGQKATITDRGAVLFSVGYDWGLSENTTLGLSADGFMMDGGDIPGYDDGGIGANGLTLQFNWYL